MCQPPHPNERYDDDLLSISSTESGAGSVLGVVAGVGGEVGALVADVLSGVVVVSSADGDVGVVVDGDVDAVVGSVLGVGCVGVSSGDGVAGVVVSAADDGDGSGASSGAGAGDSSMGVGLGGPRANKATNCTRSEQWGEA